MLNELNIYIQVQSIYIKNQSLLKESQFVFAYTIYIRNLDRISVQLITNYWLITNSDAKCTKIQDHGVLGKQPIIQPSAEYCYTSGAIIETQFGRMEGHYIMLDNDDKKFCVDIPVFCLAIPTLIN